MIEPHLLEEASLEAIVQSWDEANQKEEDAKAEAVAYKNEMLVRLKKEKIDSKVVGDRIISKVKRVTFTTPMKVASELGATKVGIDTDKLRELYNRKIKFEGVRVSEYVQVRQVGQKEE